MQIGDVARIVRARIGDLQANTFGRSSNLTSVLWLVEASLLTRVSMLRLIRSSLHRIALKFDINAPSVHGIPAAVHNATAMLCNKALSRHNIAVALHRITAEIRAPPAVLFACPRRTR